MLWRAMNPTIASPHRHYPILCLAAAAGVVSGFLGSRYPYQRFGILSIAALAPTALLALNIPRLCQHLTWCAVNGGILGAGAIAGPIIATRIAGQGISALWKSTFLVPLVLAGATAAFIGAVGLVAWTIILRHTLLRIVVQDGSLCPRCGYCIRHLPTSRCPECGGPFDLERLGRRVPRVRPPRGKARWVAVLVGVLCLGASLGTCYGTYVRSAATWQDLMSPAYWNYVARSDNLDRGKEFGEYLSKLLTDVIRKSRKIRVGRFRTLVGPPDGVQVEDSGTYYLYVYDSGKMEAITHFVDGELKDIWFQISGVNDRSYFRPYPLTDGP